MRNWTKEQVEAANSEYHKIEAALYDSSHPEILWCERMNWICFFEEWFKRDQKAVRIVDVGAGTGFVFEVAQSYLRPGDSFIATDLSPDMLAIAEKKRNRIDIEYQSLVCPSDKLSIENGSVDLVTMNSVLHHFPEVESSIFEASRILKPGGTLVVMHEPNLNFSNSPIMVWIAMNVSRVNYFFTKSLKKTSEKKESGIFQAVNRRLRERGLIQRDLTNAEIQGMVDIHSPTATGVYEPVGFTKQTFIGDGSFKLKSYKTYNFLGKIDPTANYWKRLLDRCIGYLAREKGSLFSVVLTKKS